MGYHKCLFCSREFSSKRNVNCHIATYLNEQPYECKQGARSFKTNTNLSGHARSHTNIRTYNCEKCPKTLKYQSDLKRHVQTIHEELKPFKGATCKSKFTEKSKLNRHMGTHIEEKPYGCDIFVEIFFKRVI